MGKWTLENITGDSNDYDQNNMFGHNVHIRFRLRYRPALIGRFVDTPQLVWYEQITVKDHARRSFWSFEGNLFEHKRSSRTLRIWSRRYLEAYRAATGTPSIYRGSSRLLDGNNNPVPAAAFGVVGDADREHAEAIRSYIRRHGDILQIEIHDIPSLLLAREHVPVVNKERLLLFTFGVEGSDVWRRASQYIRYDSNTIQAIWTRHFALEPLERGMTRPSWSRGERATSRFWVDGFTTTGFTEAIPPHDVASPEDPPYDPQPAYGEYR